MTPTRRNFLTYLGTGTYALLTGPLAAVPEFPLRRRKGPAPKFFKPIKATAADRLEVPSDYSWDVVCAWKDPLGSRGPLGNETFGFNNDFLAYFPIDALEGGANCNEGLLFVNHEYPSPLFVVGYTGKGAKTQEQILAEKRSVGASVIHVKRDKGKWKHVPCARHNRRLTALYPEMKMTGPVADMVPAALGTLANCSGGHTPWNTALSCEENYQDYHDPTRKLYYRWGDVAAHAIDEKQYGWVIEVDPFGQLPPRKHSALGRFSHENTAFRIGPKGKLVVYMGDDADDQYLYKFVSTTALDRKAPRKEQSAVLEAGTLYVANFETGQWLALDLKKSKELGEAGFKSQGEVLLNTRKAATALKATPIDRPEDCEVHPRDGSLYIALTGNLKHGNVYGQIIRLVEDNDDPEGESFRFELFLAGGPQSGLSYPDNLMFDRDCNLWVACDISTEKVNAGPQKPFANNGLFVVPTSGDATGDAFQFASGPVHCEMTGPCFTPKQDTLFLAVQHPGELSKSLKEPTSHWPDGGDALPKPAVVAITGFKW